MKQFANATIIFSLFVAIALWWLAGFFSGTEQSEQAIQSASADADEAPSLIKTQELPNPPSAAQTKNQNINSAAAAAAVAAPLNYPNTVNIYNEVAEDPHSTPRSLLVFAADVSRKMESALKSQSRATPVVHELEQCASAGGSNPAPVQYLCIVNARLLAEKFPSFHDNYKRILSNASPDAIRMLRITQ